MDLKKSMKVNEWISRCPGIYSNCRLPDGTLRSRTMRTRRIVTVASVDAAGDTTWRNINRDLTSTHRYRGSFEIVSGADGYERVNTATGYYDCREGRAYYYLTNRQGSVMAVVDDAGNMLQRSGLYPSGTPSK